MQPARLLIHALSAAGCTGCGTHVPRKLMQPLTPTLGFCPLLPVPIQGAQRGGSAGSPESQDLARLARRSGVHGRIAPPISFGSSARSSPTRVQPKLSSLTRPSPSRNGCRAPSTLGQVYFAPSIKRPPTSRSYAVHKPSPNTSVPWQRQGTAPSPYTAFSVRSGCVKRSESCRPQYSPFTRPWQRLLTNSTRDPRPGRSGPPRPCFNPWPNELAIRGISSPSEWQSSQWSAYSELARLPPCVYPICPPPAAWPFTTNEQGAGSQPPLALGLRPGAGNVRLVTSSERDPPNS